MNTNLTQHNLISTFYVQQNKQMCLLAFIVEVFKFIRQNKHILY